MIDRISFCYVSRMALCCVRLSNLFCLPVVYAHHKVGILHPCRKGQLFCKVSRGLLFLENKRFLGNVVETEWINQSWDVFWMAWFSILRWEISLLCKRNSSDVLTEWVFGRRVNVFSEWLMTLSRWSRRCFCMRFCANSSVSAVWATEVWPWQSWILPTN